jgi:hypothetical protein
VTAPYVVPQPNELVFEESHICHLIVVGEVDCCSLVCFLFV